MSDAASPRIGMEERHLAAQRMAARYSTHESLRATVLTALEAHRAFCLDDERELVAIADAVVARIAQSTDARFLRELLGEDSADRLPRLIAHGALTERAAQAAWRLAGGE